MYTIFMWIFKKKTLEFKILESDELITVKRKDITGVKQGGMKMPNGFLPGVHVFTNFGYAFHVNGNYETIKKRVY